MSTKGEHHSIPLSVLLKRESANEKIDNPELVHGQFNQSKKGEDFTFVKTECQRVTGDGVTAFSVFGVSSLHLLVFEILLHILWIGFDISD